MPTSPLAGTAIGIDQLTASLSQSLTASLAPYLQPPETAPDFPALPEGVAHFMQAFQLPASARRAILSIDASGTVQSFDIPEARWSSLRLDQAQMQMGVLEGIEHPLNAMLPIAPLGTILVGGTIGLMTDNVLDIIIPRFQQDDLGNDILDPAGFPLNNWTSTIAKGVAGVAIWMVGPQLMSGRAAFLAGAFPVVHALADITFIQSLLAKFVGFFKKPPAAPVVQGHAQQTRPILLNPSTVSHQNGHFGQESNAQDRLAGILR